MALRIYLRNSSDKQAKAGTIAAQRPPCRVVADKHGGGAIEYADEGVSGDAPLAERAALHRLLADLAPGDRVVAFAQDRLSRTDDMIEHAAVFGVFQRRGVLVETVQEGEIDVRDQVGRLRALLQGDAAAAEKRKILARTSAGKKSAAATGRKPQGRTPFGLRYDRGAKQWSVDEPAAAIVRSIFADLLAGKTIASIAKRLREEGAPAPRVGWGPSSVWRIATRTTYRGEWTFDGQTIAVPAIVDGETWARAQAQMLAANRRGLKRTQHVYLLDDGIGRCDVCDGRLRIKWGGKDGQRPFYVCPSKPCGLRWRRTEDADAETWQRIVAALRRPDLVEEALRGGREAAEDAKAGEGDAAGYEAQLARLDAVEGAMATRFRSGALSEGVWDRELVAIGRQRKLLQQSIAASREAARLARAGAAAIEGLRGAIATFADHIEGAAPAERRKVIHEVLRPSIRVPMDGPILIAFRLRAPAPATGKPSCEVVSGSSACSGNEDYHEIAVVA